MKTLTRPALVFLFFLLSSADAFAFEGPLRIKNSHPLFISIGSPGLVSARPGSFYGMNISYSSTYLVDSSPEWSMGIDVEAAVAELVLRRAFGGSFEAGVTVPFMSYNSGFLDGFLEDYHRAFGFPDYGRSSRPLNEFLLDVRRNGVPAVQGSSGETAPGDVLLTLKKALYCRGACFSVMGFAELPTGDAGKGYGSGSVEAGGALLIDKPIGSTLILYANAGWVHGDELKAFINVELDDYFYAGGGVEWAYSDRLLLNGEAFCRGSPFEKTSIRGIDDASVILSIGGRYLLQEGSYVEFSFTEDPSTSGAPDFMGSIGWGRRF